ncbi:MAG: TRAP transporter substrate-binding protein DctP [Proteobacteria bacterium]|nr:TRAP transporter substrate-binding protein DctP [Pseudomonadota bacterium]MDA1022588.1 TRAP transporter substrate-binding protein DctP [Pseudomonadota bacterium]
MNILKRLITIGAVATFALGVALPNDALAEAKHKWKMAASWGGGPLMAIGAKAFAEKVKFLTDGRIEIKVFPSGQLSKGLEVRSAVAKGVAEMGHTWMGYDWGKDKTTVLFGGYAGSMDSERMLHWIYEGGGLEMQRQFNDEKFGVVSMPLFTRTAEAFLHSRKPVRTLADLNGLKFRTAGAWLAISKGLGAAPVTMPGGEVYTSLERGAIDATEWGTLYENKSTGFHKIAKYVIIPGIHQPTAPFELVINKKAWASLSKRDQEIVAMAAKLVTFESWTRIGHEDAKALDFYRKAGNEVIVLDAAVQSKAKKLGIAWAQEQAKANPWFDKVLKSQIAFETLWKDASHYRNVISE